MPFIAEVDDWEVLSHCCAAGRDGQKPSDIEKTIHGGKQRIENSRRGMKVPKAAPLCVIRVPEKVMFLIISSYRFQGVTRLTSAYYIGTYTGPVILKRL